MTATPSINLSGFLDEQLSRAVSSFQESSE